MGRLLRSQQFSVTEISVVHITQRCVRRAFLAGVDESSGKDYSPRREWIRRRLEALASVFSIDVLSYAVLSNHMHLILRNRPDIVATWSDREIAIRWLRVFPGRRLGEHLGEPTEHDVETLVRDKDRIELLRRRLVDISWFMKSLSEPIARMANKQDECRGAFWESRFHAQRLVDEVGVLACAAYVDLNPVRASIAETPDESRHTSAFDRIEGCRGRKIDSAAFDLKPVSTEESAADLCQLPVEVLRSTRRRNQRRRVGKRILRDAWLAPIRMRALSDNPESHRGGLRASDKGFLEMGRDDYLRLLRWTATQGTGMARMQAPRELNRLLKRVGIKLTRWRDVVWNFRTYFSGSCAGSPSQMSEFARSTGRRWPRGYRAAAACFE